MKKYKIAVAGTGYVGLSIQNNQLHHLYSGIIHLMSCGYSQPYLLCWAI